jgi:hypothetical protein
MENQWYPTPVTLRTTGCCTRVYENVSSWFLAIRIQSKPLSEVCRSDLFFFSPPISLRRKIIIRSYCKSNTT